MADRRKYIVLFAGWVAGRRVEAGDEIMLTEAEAEYEHVTLASAESVSRIDVVQVPVAKGGKRK